MTRSHRCVGLLSLGLLAASSLSALPVMWEATFGPQAGFDDAGGIDLSASCGSRYVVAGRAQTAQGTHDFYVFLADENGSTALGFENTYDIGGAQGQDQAGGIRRTGDGFIVTGSTDMGVANGPTRLVLLKLRCDGEVSWIRTYGDPDGNYVGRDVIVNDDGDYTAAGWRLDRKSGLREAFLVRVLSNGTPRWHHAFRGTHGIGYASDNGFYALTQNALRTGQATGDITAVGFTTGPQNGRDAWVVRVDGATGLIGAPPQGGAFYSSPGQEDFNAVRELQVPPETGRLVYAGHTGFMPGGIDDIYLVKSTQLPWGALLQVGVGDNVGPRYEYGMGFVEMQTNSAFSQAGDLALTGVAVNRLTSPPGELDGFLLKIDRTTLGPSNIGGLGTPGFYYGDHNLLDDGGYGIVYDNHPVQDYVGFAIIGFSKSNLEGAAPPDPNDAYLLKTDLLGRTGCQENYPAYRRDLPYYVQQDTIETRDPARDEEPGVVVTPEDWGKLVCSK